MNGSNQDLRSIYETLLDVQNIFEKVLDDPDITFREAMELSFEGSRIRHSKGEKEQDRATDTIQEILRGATEKKLRRQSFEETLKMMRRR
jgi:hypothetical protein